MKEVTCLDTTILLLRQVDIHHFVEVSIEIVLAAKALIQLLELIVGEGSISCWLCLVHTSYLLFIEL